MAIILVTEWDITKEKESCDLQHILTSTVAILKPCFQITQNSPLWILHCSDDPQHCFFTSPHSVFHCCSQYGNEYQTFPQNRQKLKPGSLNVCPLISSLTHVKCAKAVSSEAVWYGQVSITKGGPKHPQKHTALHGEAFGFISVIHFTVFFTVGAVCW